jgi:hypothetical protein
LFVSVFLFNIWGYYPVFIFQQHKVRSEAKDFAEKGYGKAKFVFTFTQQQFDALRWIKENEFVLNGSYYDILKQQLNRNGTVTLYCYLDSKETKLVDHFNKHISRNMEDRATSQNNGKNNVKNPIKDLLPPATGLSSCICFVQISFHDTTHKLKKPCLRAEVPPPRYI